MEDDGDAVCPTFVKDRWGEAVRVRICFSSWEVGTIQEVNDRVGRLSCDLSKVVVLPWRAKTSCRVVIALAGPILVSGGGYLSFESMLLRNNDHIF